MKTQKKASPGNGKNSKAKNQRKQSGHSSRFAKSLLLTEGLLIVLAVMVLMGIRLWQKSNPASAASAVLQDKPDGLNLVHASDPSARSAKAAQKNSKDSSGDTPKGLQPEAFAPHCTESTAPSNYIQTTEINIDGTTLTDPLSYKPDQEISFGKGSEYTDVDGIVTFRGNNFRDNPVYGTADMKKNKLTSLWSSKTSSITYNGATWSGSGWTGQPLMMKWPKKVKKAMNMYDWAKEKDDLVEVIYACMDGYVYFLDLETGEATRDTLNLGFTFKGSGALDPRGYPILYVGAGYDSNQGTARVFVVNLLDCSIMYTFGNNDPFSLRGALSYFDSSPLVDADTDTLIYPGENGILYLIRLNTQYDQEAGTLSINPDHIVKWHYYGNRTSVASYWLGMEDSAAVYGGYLFVTDNGGNLMCLDLNTLQLVWAQDTLDDSNSTPVLSIEDDHLYLYVSTSFRLGWRSSSSAEVPIWKIDAQNGHIIWKTSYECYSDDGVSGGVQSTIALGKKKLSDYIYVTVAKTGAQYDGVLACLDKKTGEVKWEHKAYYAWSSPVCVYNSDGSGKVLYCSCGGKAYLLDGNSGKLLDENEISSGAIEASPAIYNDYMVVGTRDCRICGLKLE
ncbi:MAG: PQQ-binding-like beta-propeller repeat protein [Blautia glucerasea]|nr:PQQ-binding-like beta-propeller repeat protein [Blautia glucerasea]